MIRLDIVVADISDVMDAGYTVIRVYTDTSQTGNFTTLDGTATLVAGQTKYTYVDVDGTASTWYKVAYYGAVPGESSKSEAMRGGQVDAYCSVDEVKEILRKDDTTHDAVFLTLIERATNFIDRFCRRPDGFVAAAVADARVFEGSGKAVQWLDECVEVTKVEVKDSHSDSEYDEWEGTDWWAATGDPDSPDWNRLPFNFLLINEDEDGREDIFTRGQRCVRVTARWGYAVTVPEAVKQACITQVCRWWKRAEGGFADRIGNPDFGVLSYARKLDPDVELLLADGGFVRSVVG